MLFKVGKYLSFGLYFILIFISLGAQSPEIKKLLIGDVPEGMTIETFSKSRLKLTDTPLFKEHYQINIVTGEPFNTGDYTHIWIRRIFNHSEKETDFTNGKVEKENPMYYETYYLGRISKEDSMYILKSFLKKSDFLFVCAGRHQENIWYYNGARVPVFIPGIRFFLTSAHDKIYSQTRDKKLYQYNFELGILKQINCLPRDCKQDFYDFPVADRIK